MPVPVTPAAQVVQLIVLQLGDAPDNRLQANVWSLWNLYNDKGAIAPRLQALYTERDCLKLLLGYYRGKVNFAEASNVSVQAHQKVDSLLAMQKNVEAQIALVETKARANRPAVVTPITQATPETPPALPPELSPPALNPPDANDPRYSGDPYASTAAVR